jgi:ADP-ribosylation factor-binding protein GGA
MLIRAQGFALKLEPQTGRSLLPRQNTSSGVRQNIVVCHAGDENKKVESIRLRWRVAYKVGDEVRSEMGEIPEFSIA